MALMKIALEQLWEVVRCLKIQRIWQENCCKSKIINRGRLGFTASEVFLAVCYLRRKRSFLHFTCVASVVKLLFYLWKNKILLNVRNS